MITDLDIADLKKVTELILQQHGYDFRDYALSSFKRRVLRILELGGLTIDSLLKKIADQPGYINEFLDELTVNVTEMFRDPGFWRLLPGVHRAKKLFP